MKKYTGSILVLVTTLLVGTAATAKDRVTDLGKWEFEASCAICHGLNGKGGGMIASALKSQPTDLTLLSKNNGGVFPIDRVTAVIDGRAEVKLHGTRDMPIWGTRFSVSAAEHYFDVPYDQDAYVRNNILNLTDYLYRIQQK